MRRSVSQRFLIGLGLTSLAFTLVTAVCAFAVFKRQLEDRQIQFLSQYVEVRTLHVGRRFSNLITLQRSAIDALAAQMDSTTPQAADAILKRETRLLPDGTRRSRDRDFTGYTDRAGGRIYGVAVFIPKAKTLSDQDKVVLASAFPIVSRFGQAAHGDYDNFYFVAPYTKLVMFGPDRPDHLMFYRKDAPADFDVSKEEMSRFITREADPLGETRCTSLQHLAQDTTAKQRVATACMTPAYVHGRFVGSFGSSIRLDNFLNGVVGEGLAGADTLIVRADGQLIAAPGAPLAATRTEAAVAAYEHKLGLTALTARIGREGRSFGVLRSANGRDIVAYGRLKGPGWYLLITYPAAAVAWSAVQSASWVLVLGLLGAALQTIVVLNLARSTIVKPLGTLAASCQSRDLEALSDLSAREDEIGVLASSLSAERQRADELLASLERRVQERTAELEHANAEKSRFLANMSHELRTPLNGVIALAENLSQEQITPRNRELADLIVASGRLLEQVLTDILDFSKIEAGEMRIERHRFNLETTVARVAELHRASADAKGISLSWSVDPSLEGDYAGDSVRLTQVLSNLLSNAVKFTEAGYVRLTVTSDMDGGVVFNVQDTGIGFDESARTRLFQRFEQADVSIRRRFGGTGLGLAICRSLVELMGGAISACSAPGEGSVFSVVLPLERRAQVEDHAAEPQEEEGEGLEGVRVLLAEDHPTNQKVIQLILDTVGADLVIVDNGRRALDALASSKFDIVLMDMQMPELDGLSATAQLRALEAEGGLERTPLIMLTANAMDEHVAASLRAGADRHISKPVRAAELLAAISAVLRATSGGALTAAA